MYHTYVNHGSFIRRLTRLHCEQLTAQLILFFLVVEVNICFEVIKAGMRIRIRSDPVIFGPPDPVLFSTDPDPDPTCNNGFIKLFLS